MTAPAAPSGPKVDIRKEVRFAVVLYGGVSLAVYIGGVVKELLAMVRATALDNSAPGGATSLRERDATGSIAVYRELANLLNRPDANATDDETTIYTRFVVDIISGTSAGGLNGIYLAKALARGQDLKHLRGLWLGVGDIETLLNKADPKPRSVLNGATMLGALFAAFRTMEGQPLGPSGGGLVDDVQCFATTTDLRGLPMPLLLADRAVIENRYRHVHRFAFSNGIWAQADNDFVDNDAALALAARSTSAFPGAFPPVRVGDTSLLDPSDPLSLRSTELMYAGYDATTAAENGKGFGSIFDARTHGFADGGILNNKPFGHAIAALGSRRGGKPSERKLLYVEPSPEFHVELSEARTERTDDLSQPGFFSVIQSAYGLPSEQTIRQDLERVLDRNRTIDRMNGILADIPEEVRRHHSLTVTTLEQRVKDSKGMDAVAAKLLRVAKPTSAQDAADAFKTLDVGDMMQLYGLGYGGYQRLTVASVTDDLSLMVTRLAGFDEQSEELQAIRALVRAWRDLAYRPYLHDEPASERLRTEVIKSAITTKLSDPAVDPKFNRAAASALQRIDNGRKAENLFLLEFDIRYRLRRLDFILNKIDDMFCLDDRGRLLLRSFGVQHPDTWMNETRRATLGAMAQGLTTIYMMLRTRAETVSDKPTGNERVDAAPFSLTEWQEKFDAWTPVSSHRVAGNQKAAAAIDNSPQSIEDAVAQLEITHVDLRTLLEKSGSARDDLAVQMVTERLDAFTATAAVITDRFYRATSAASQWATRVLPESDAARARLEGGGFEPGDIARFYYDNYQSVDRITFPVFYETAVGQEVDAVGVVRVSPVDARAIVAPPAHGEPRRRLGGETLGHFGGFFSKKWRANDFLWGQLDGAERLITAVCAGASNIDSTKQEELIRRTHLAILGDDANVDGIAEFKGLSAEARYEYLKTRSGDLVSLNEEVRGTFARAIAGAVPILGRIFAKGEGGPVGVAASILGRPAIFLAESAIKPLRGAVVVIGAWLCIAAGLLGIGLTFGLGLPLPTGWPRAIRILAMAGSTVGELALMIVGVVTLRVRRRIKKFIKTGPKV